MNHVQLLDLLLELVLLTWRCRGNNLSVAENRRVLIGGTTTTLARFTGVLKMSPNPYDLPVNGSMTYERVKIDLQCGENYLMSKPALYLGRVDSGKYFQFQTAPI